MNVIWMYYICHVVIIMWLSWITSISCLSSLPFTNPLPCPHGIVKSPCTLQNLAGNSRSSGDFLPTLLWVLWHTYFVTYCFSLLCIREVCDFDAEVCWHSRSML